MGEEAPEKTLRELTSMGRFLYKVASCGDCGLLGHHNDQCPKLKEVSAMGGFRRNDSQSNTYNSGWRDHPNLKWGP
uniref:CCHC-type domain-containing protein n=1 Tax=Cucumis melo TaxID=3656 RepID=A0A9I9EEJ6_CUCME